MHQPETDVLIAGAGPSGLMMACQLAMRKINFRIIDKRPSGSAWSGALIIHAATLEIFHQLGMSDRIHENAQIIRAVNFSFNGKHIGRLDVSNYGQGLTRFPYLLMLEQSKTEEVMINFLQKLHIKVERETRLIEITAGREHVALILKGHSGEEKVHSRYLIAADGGESFVRSKLNIPFNGKTHLQTLFTVDGNMNFELPHDEVLFSFSKEASAGFFPLSHDRWRIDGTASWKRKNEITFNHIQKDFKNIINQDFNLISTDWFSTFHSHSKISGQLSSGHCFLIGDAAHIFSPVGAQGMNHGLQDACNLGWKLAMVIEKKIKGRILNSYAKERKPVIRKIAFVTNGLYCLLSSQNMLIKMMRLYFFPWLIRLLLPLLGQGAFKKILFNGISGLGYSYRNGLVIHEKWWSRIKPGIRVPYINYTEKGQISNTRDIITYDRFHLFIFLPEKSENFLINLAEEYKDVIKTHRFRYHEGTRELFQNFKAGFCLVRPDLYIACIGRDAGSLEKYLSLLVIQK